MKKTASATIKSATPPRTAKITDVFGILVPSPAAAPARSREILSVPTALLVGARPGDYFSKEEEHLSFNWIYVRGAAKWAERLSHAFPFARIILIFSTRHE